MIAALRRGEMWSLGVGAGLLERLGQASTWMVDWSSPDGLGVRGEPAAQLLRDVARALVGELLDLALQRLLVGRGELGLARPDGEGDVLDRDRRRGERRASSGLGAAEQRLAAASASGAPGRAARAQPSGGRAGSQVAGDHRDGPPPAPLRRRRSGRRPEGRSRGCSRSSWPGAAATDGLEGGRARGEVLLRDAEAAPGRRRRPRSGLVGTAAGVVPGRSVPDGAAKPIETNRLRRGAARVGRVGDCVWSTPCSVALRVRVVAEPPALPAPV